MPSIHRDEAGIWHYNFRIFKRQYNPSLKTRDEKEARRLEFDYNETVKQIKQARIALPDEIQASSKNLWEFIRTNGARSEPRNNSKVLTLNSLFKTYFESLPSDSKDSKTLYTEGIHCKHLLRIIKANREVPSIKREDLQTYISKRGEEKTKKKTNVRATTIKKEIATFRMVWNRKLDEIGKPCPANQLQYPRGREKSPFQTWDEINAKLGEKKRSPNELKEAWESLYLDGEQVREFLGFMQDKMANTNNKYLHPFLFFVAHTGVRRSEAARAKREDFNFETGFANIREKKRTRGKDTYRQVPISSRLKPVLEEYFNKHHPSGEMAFYNADGKPVEPKSVGESFKWYLKDSKWKVLSGLHVFRHSYASNQARKGTEQRIIDEIMGHETEAMTKRYRHLFPNQKKEVAEVY